MSSRFFFASGMAGTRKIGEFPPLVKINAVPVRLYLCKRGKIGEMAVCSFTEDELRECLRTGDAAAFGKLYDFLGADLYRYALAALRSRRDAEDLVQDLFLKTMESRARIAAAKSVKAYLFAMARNMALDVLRSRGRTTSLEDEPYLEAEAPGGVASDEAALLCRALDALPFEQKEAVVMKFYQDMTFEEIAVVVGAKRDTVVSRYRYGLEKLREFLGGLS